MNQLFIGDNIDVLRASIQDATVSVAYIDPPFLSNPQAVPTQHVLDDYLLFLRLRLIEIRRVLNQSGSTFVHAAPELAHHVRALLDDVFGAEAFVNEIVWTFARSATAGEKSLASQHELIFWYARESGHHKFNLDELVAEVEPKNRARYFGDVWSISARPFTSRADYLPTQKPVELVERLLVLASDPGDLVLDPFFGSGATGVAAQRLSRDWIGIEIDQSLVKVVAQRLFDELGPSGTTGYEVIGTPTSEEEIRALARNNPLQFERWVIGRLGARPRGYSRADRGADADLELPGRLGGGGRARAVVEVKAREFRAVDLENLRLVARLDRADAGVLVVLTMTGDATQSYGRGEPPLTPEEGSPPPILLVIPAAELLDEDGAQRFAAILADAVAHG